METYDEDFAPDASTPLKLSSQAYNKRHAHTSSDSVSESGGSTASLLFSDDNKKESDFSSGMLDVDVPGFTIKQSIHPDTFAEMEDDKSNTIKALRDNTLSVEALKQLASLTSSGKAQFKKGSDASSSHASEANPLAKLLQRPPSSAQVRGPKCSTSSLASHSEEGEKDKDFEAAFALPANVDRVLLSSARSAVKKHSRDSSAATSSSDKSMKQAFPAAHLSKQPFSPASSGKKSSLAVEEQDAAFFDDFVDIPTYFDVPKSGRLSPALDGQGPDLQSILKSRLELRASLKDFPTQADAQIHPPHPHASRRNAHLELFEDGLEIDDSSFVNTKEKPGIKTMVTPGKRRALVHSRSFMRAASDAGLRRSPTMHSVPSHQSNLSTLNSRSSFKRTDSFPSTSQRTLKYKKSTPHLQQAPTSDFSVDSTVKSLARKRSMPALPRLDTQLFPTADSMPALPRLPSNSMTGGHRAKRTSSNSSQFGPLSISPPSSSASNKSPFYPPARPSTPSTSAAAVRLTMPIASSKAKQKLAAHTASFVSPVDLSGRSTTLLMGNTGRNRTTSLITQSKSSHTSMASLAATPSSILRKPKKSKQYGDGTELDEIDDLPTNRDKERRFVRRPTNARATSLDVLPSSPSNKSLAEQHTRTQSAQVVVKIDRKQRVNAVPQRTPMHSLERTLYSKNKSNSHKPHLIRNLGNSTNMRIEGDMVWNPDTMKWEGNEVALQAFDNALASSARPALITNFSAGMLSPSMSRGTPGSVTTAGLGGVRVVGNMVFDPVQMCWFNLDEQAAEEDELDFGDDESEPLDRQPWSRADWSTNGDHFRNRRASFVSNAASFGGHQSQAAQALFVKSCQEAELRHVQELKHWSQLTREQARDRNYLWDIRKIIMKEQ